MKNYNLRNYIRYKKDLKSNELKEKPLKEHTRDELIIRFIPYAESIARKFSTSHKSSGIMNTNDILQEANISLISAVDRIKWDVINADSNVEIQIKGFIKKRIKGSIRRAIDINRADIRIPEHILSDIRRCNGEDEKKMKMFFNSVFLSLDEMSTKINSEIEDKSEAYTLHQLNEYILSVMKKCLTKKEYDVIEMSFGLNCDKLTAKKIAKKLKIKGISDFVRISQIKREALDKLIKNLNKKEVIDYRW